MLVIFKKKLLKEWRDSQGKLCFWSYRKKYTFKKNIKISFKFHPFTRGHRFDLPDIPHFLRLKDNKILHCHRKRISNPAWLILRKGLKNRPSQFIQTEKPNFKLKVVFFMKTKY